MRKRYALCISGEFRTCALAWKNNLRFFHELSNEYYFFVTTWDFNSGPNREINLINLVLNNIFGYQFNYPRPSSISESDVLQVFQGINNVFVKVIPESLWHSVKSKIYNLPSGRLENRILRSMRMFYLMETCDSQRRAYEQESGVKFDAVLRVRPDSILKHNVFSQFNTANTDLLFYADPNQEKYLWGPVNDQLFVGKSEVMTHVTSTFSALLDYSKEEGWYLPKESIHEVLVSESALSWHVKGIRDKFVVNSTSTKTELLRPRRKFIVVDAVQRQVIKSQTKYIVRHLLRKRLAGVINLIRGW